MRAPAKSGVGFRNPEERAVPKANPKNPNACSPPDAPAHVRGDRRRIGSGAGPYGASPGQGQGMCGRGLDRLEILGLKLARPAPRDCMRWNQDES